jgi:hypothetical protein
MHIESIKLMKTGVANDIEYHEVTHIAVIGNIIATL